jgi:hypothetical protein
MKVKETKMANSKEDVEKKQVMDVAKPGKSAPDSTGRPVIIGHKPLLKQDPMVNGDSNKDAEETADEKLAPLHGEKVIAPPEDVPPKEETAEAPAQPAPEPAEEKPEEKPQEETPVGDDSAAVDAVAEQANAKKKDGEISEEDIKKQEALAKLVEEKKYFVPINVASRKRNARWSVVILILLLLFVGAYLAADAGVVKAPFKLPIHIIPT